MGLDYREGLFAYAPGAHTQCPHSPLRLPRLTHSARTFHCAGALFSPLSYHHAACTVCAKGTRRTSPHRHASRVRSQCPPAATVRGAASRPRSTGRGACPQTAGSGRKRSSTCAAYETAGPHSSTSTAQLRETPLQRRSWPPFFRPTAAQAKQPTTTKHRAQPYTVSSAQYGWARWVATPYGGGELRVALTQRPFQREWS